MIKLLFGLFISLLMFFPLGGTEALYLRNNLKKAQKGDFIVTNQNKTYSLLYIMENDGGIIAIQEINIPANKVPRVGFSWREWTIQGAPGNTSRTLYNIDLQSAQIQSCYCMTRNGWSETAITDHFFSTLLNLRLELIPAKQRRRVGVSGLPSPYDKRPIWHPTVTIDGKTITGVPLDAWQAVWPKDGSELSGKTIEAYLPQESSNYPAYFPYWMQVNSMVGNAKIRIIDSGRGL